MPTSSSKAAATFDYGHKLNLTTGQSGLILDLVVEAGNPADSERLLPMLERHIARHGEAPRQLAADGGFATRDNLSQAKARGVRDLAFHKKRGLRIEDMVRSRWVYRKLRNFRAGIEADISCLKRAYGLARCTWRGLSHFKAYVWSSVVAYNLALSRASNPPERPSSRAPPTRSHGAGPRTHASTWPNRFFTSPTSPTTSRQKLPIALSACTICSVLLQNKPNI